MLPSSRRRSAVFFRHGTSHREKASCGDISSKRFCSGIPRIFSGALLIFCFAALFAGAILLNIHNAEENTARAQAASAACVCAAMLRQTGEAMLHSAYTLELFLQEKHRIYSEKPDAADASADIENAVRGMVRLYPHLRALRLTYNGPPDRKHLLLPDAFDRGPSAMCRRPALLSAPVMDVFLDPVQKEYHLVGSFPMQNRNADSDHGPAALCITFRFPELPVFSRPDMRKYAWELRRWDAEAEHTSLLAASATPLRGHAQESFVQLPGTTWLFRVAAPSRRLPPTYIVVGTTVCVSLALAGAWLLRLLEKKKHLERISCTDVLTGLANRRLLFLRLGQTLAGKPKPGHSLAVCYVDLDGFKEVNDILGHKSGDQLLVTFAGHLNALLKEGETAARIGGDEFVLLLDVKGREECAQRLRKLAEQLQSPFRLEGGERRVHASIGVALWPENGDTADQLLHYADQAMYHAKNSESAPPCFHCPTTER